MAVKQSHKGAVILLRFGSYPRGATVLWQYNNPPPRCRRRSVLQSLPRGAVVKQRRCGGGLVEAPWGDRAAWDSLSATGRWRRGGGHVRLYVIGTHIVFCDTYLCTTYLIFYLF